MSRVDSTIPPLPPRSTGRTFGPADGPYRIVDRTDPVNQAWIRWDSLIHDRRRRREWLAGLRATDDESERTLQRIEREILAERRQQMGSGEISAARYHEACQLVEAAQLQRQRQRLARRARFETNLQDESFVRRLIDRYVAALFWDRPLDLFGEASDFWDEEADRG